MAGMSYELKNNQTINHPPRALYPIKIDDENTIRDYVLNKSSIMMYSSEN